MKISLIAAMSTNRVIGYKGQLPWHLPEDLKFFKETTLGHPVLMGRKTFESIGRPLPKRLNLVITRSQKEDTDRLKHFQSLEAAIAFCRQQSFEEVFVVGGAEIYSQALDFADRIYLTVIDREFEGDTFFPVFNEKEFSQECLMTSTSGEWPFEIRLYSRNQNL